MDPAAARAAFERALEPLGKDDALVVERLEALAKADPHGEYTDDALIEAAQLLEEKLGRPDRARDLYARLLEIDPESRLALRARARLDFLDANLRTGAAPLAEYQRILYGFSARPTAESARMMEALLEAHPDFALADKALLWLAGLDLREGRQAQAEARYLDLEQRFANRAGGEAWSQARKGRAELALASGHPIRARDLFQSILDDKRTTEVPGMTSAARAGVELSMSSLRRMIAFYLALGWISLFVTGCVLSARPLRMPRPLPFELLFYLPVAGLLALCGATENRAITIATSILAGGGLVILVASTLSTRTRIERGPMSLAERLVRAVLLALTAFALLYAAVHIANITDMVVETLVHGPDR